MVACGRKIEQQGFVEIVLHVAQRQRRPFRHRFRKGKGFLLQAVIRHHAVEEANPLASFGIDPLGGKHQFACPRCADQPRQQPGNAVVAAERNPQIAGRNECRACGDANVAGHGDGETCACRRAGQSRDGRLAYRDQRAGQQALAFLKIRDLLVIGHFQLLLVAMGAHALDVAARAERRAGAGDQECADIGVLAAGPDHGAQRRREMVGQRIARLRPVQRDDRDAVPDHAEKFIGAGIDGDFGCHVISRFSVIARSQRVARMRAR